MGEQKYDTQKFIRTAVTLTDIGAFINSFYTTVLLYLLQHAISTHLEKSSHWNFRRLISL